MVKLGRPSLYKPEMLEVMENYITNHASLGDPFPSVAGLALLLNVGKRTLHDWNVDPKKPEFSHMFARMKLKQEQVLLANGITGDFNSAIAKLVLSKHGYVEKQESKHEHVGKGGQTLKWEIEFVDKKDIEEAEKK